MNYERKKAEINIEGLANIGYEDIRALIEQLSFRINFHNKELGPVTGGQQIVFGRMLEALHKLAEKDRLYRSLEELKAAYEIGEISEVELYDESIRRCQHFELDNWSMGEVFRVVKIPRNRPEPEPEPESSEIAL